MSKASIYAKLQELSQQAEELRKSSRDDMSNAHIEIGLADEFLKKAVLVAKVEAEEEQAALLVNFRSGVGVCFKNTH